MFGLSSLLNIFYALGVRGLPMSRMQWWIRPGPRRPCTNNAIFYIWKKYYSYLRTYDLYVMLLMLATPLRGQGGGGWALEVTTFLSPVKWHRAVRRVSFGAQKVAISRAQPPPTCPSNGFARIKSIKYRAVSIRGSFMHMSFCVLCSAFTILHSVVYMLWVLCTWVSGPTPSNSVPSLAVRLLWVGGRGGLCIGGGGGWG